MDNRSFEEENVTSSPPNASLSLPVSQDSASATSTRKDPEANEESAKAVDISSAGTDANAYCVEMPRSVGLVSGTCILVGSIIGAGIFISPKAVLANSGSVGLSLVIWLACSLFCMLGALCMVELSTVVPESGGVYIYILRALGPLHPYFGPLPAFLESWMTNLFSSQASAALKCLAFAQYVVAPWYAGCGSEPPMSAVRLLAVATIWLETFVHCCSTRLATRVQIFFTVTKLAVLVVIIIAGVVRLSQGHVQHLATGFEGSADSGGDIASAFFSGLYAYGGWNFLNKIVGEVSRPARTVPLAITIALLLVTAVYLLTNVAYLTALSPHQLLASPAVAVSFAEKTLGPAAFVVPFGVAFSVFGTINGGLILTGRQLMASARQGHFVDVMSFVHVHRMTPVPALLLHAATTTVWIFVGNIGQILHYIGFTSMFFTGLNMASLIVLRKTRPDAKRLYRVPLLLPVFLLAVSGYLFIIPVVQNPNPEYLGALFLLALGVLAYTGLVYYKWTPNFLKYCTKTAQMCMLILPSVEKIE